MLYYITLVLAFWALIYTAARFLQYYRIVKNYKEETQATVKQIRDHEPANRKEPPALDVLLSYEIDGEERSAQYQVGSRVGIRYYVEENGAVHVATAGDAPRRIMYGYLAAIVLEIVIYAVIWRILL